MQANESCSSTIGFLSLGSIEVWRGCLHSGIHSQHVGSCWFVVRKSYIRRVSVRQGLIQRYGDRCRQANLEVQRSVSRFWATSRSGGDACTLSMSDSVDLSFANRILLVDSASVSQDLNHCYGDRRLQANLAVQRSVSRPEKGCLEVCRGCLHSGIHSQHVGSC